jgi:hypothetical protein
VIEPVDVHFDDLDAMGVVHNGRYVLLLERALAAYWTRAGWAFDPSNPRSGEVSAPCTCGYGSIIWATPAPCTVSGCCLRMRP